MGVVWGNQSPWMATTGHHEWRDMKLLSVNVAVVQTGPWTGRMGRTGIDKRPSEGPVFVTRTGIDGDVIVDLREHGGVDRAVYAYASEDAAWWSTLLDREIKPGNLGENLTTAGIDVTTAVIGERWTIGSSILEVSGPRIPCRVFAAFWQVPDLVKRFIKAGRPGAYLRVVIEGKVAPDDKIAVVHRPDHGITVGETFRALTSEPGLLPRVASASELPQPILDRCRRRKSTQTRGPASRDNDHS
jgi:MOSC domain-containing protein YiiM